MAATNKLWTLFYTFVTTKCRQVTGIVSTLSPFTLTIRVRIPLELIEKKKHIQKEVRIQVNKFFSLLYWKGEMKKVTGNGSLKSVRNLPDHSFNWVKKNILRMQPGSTATELLFVKCVFFMYITVLQHIFKCYTMLFNR